MMFGQAQEGFQMDKREWAHRQKMECKDLNRDERSARRAAQYERMKAAAPLTVERMRKWLKSPCAFRGAA